MYKKSIPFKDFNGKPRNEVVHFNLTEVEIFKLMGEFQTVLDWRDSLQGEARELESEEVVRFYTAFEEILLSAYGVPSGDGMYFRKNGRYDFADSALFSATMMYFVANPAETSAFLNGIMPEGLEELVKKADASLAETIKNADNEELKAELERLRKKVAEQTPALGS